MPFASFPALPKIRSPPHPDTNLPMMFLLYPTFCRKSTNCRRMRYNFFMENNCFGKKLRDLRMEKAFPNGNWETPWDFATKRSVFGKTDSGNLISIHWYRSPATSRFQRTICSVCPTIEHRNPSANSALSGIHANISAQGGFTRTCGRQTESVRKFDTRRNPYALLTYDRQTNSVFSSTRI